MTVVQGQGEEQGAVFGRLAVVPEVSHALSQHQAHRRASL